MGFVMHVLSLAIPPELFPARCGRSGPVIRHPGFVAAGHRIVEDPKPHLQNLPRIPGQHRRQVRGAGPFVQARCMGPVKMHREWCVVCLFGNGL